MAAMTKPLQNERPQQHLEIIRFLGGVMSTRMRAANDGEHTIAEDGGEANINGGTAQSADQANATAPRNGMTNRLTATFAEMNGETAEELAGSYVAASTESGASVAEDAAQHVAVSGAGSATEFDSPSESGQSSSDESGLEAVQGYDPASRESGAMDESQIPEAFTADADPGDKEFFTILAKLAPILVSTVLPIIKKRVLNRKNLHRVGGFALGAARSIVGRLTESDELEESEEAIEAELEAAAEQMEVIIGTDDRTRIRNTTAVPWRRICHLTIRAKNGQPYVGTGFLIGKRTLITAGHCVYIHAAGGWPSYIDVAPGRNAGSRPFGTVRATAFRSVTGWVNSKSRSHDYGAIILPANAPPAVQSLGGFGFGYWPDHQLMNRMSNLSGYPGDGGKLGPDRETGSQWWMARKIKSVLARSFSYDIDTVGGQSGSPVWTISNGQRIVLGIHTNGFVGGNSATRITQPVFNNLKAWRTQGS